MFSSKEWYIGGSKSQSKFGFSFKNLTIQIFRPDIFSNSQLKGCHYFYYVVVLIALLLQVLSLLQTQMVSILLRVECQDARTQSISFQLLTLSEPGLVDTVFTVDSTVEAFDIIYQSCVYKPMSTQ